MADSQSQHEQSDQQPQSRRPKSWWAALIPAIIALVLGVGSVSHISFDDVLAKAGHGSSTSTTAQAKPGDSKKSKDSATTKNTADRSATSVKSCSLGSLPGEVGDTVDAIHKGGPFAASKDGTTFGNNEGVLPQQSRGYYREYTVPTPGASNRGARRVVTGGDPKTNPEHYYYSGDHYDTFCEISDAR